MVYDVQNRRSSSRMLTAVSGRYSNTVTNTYDVAGRLKDESLTIATKTYTVSRTYDSLGRLFQMTYPNSTVVERTYTDRNQLYTVKYGANIEDTRSYDDGGRLSTSAYRNGVTTTYNYRNVSGNKDNLLASIQFAHPGGTATNRQVGDLTYTWDANKNKTKETIAGTLSGYSFDTTLGADPDGYDDEDRITYFKRSNTTDPQTWTLTSVGDWSSWNNFSTTAETRTHGAAHELTRIGSGTTPATISYDVKGNITQNQRTPGTSSTYQNYVWDFDNRMISADTNGDSTADVTYEYDALGRRVARTQGATAVVYIHAGQQTVCDYARGANANSTPAFRYVWGDYIDEPILRQTGSSTLLYYHHNQQYSTVAITSASGLVVTRFGYTAYGDQTIMSHTGASQTYATYSIRHTYTGREWDDSLKAHYFRARWYDAARGRFVNRESLAKNPTKVVYHYLAAHALPGRKGKGNLTVDLNRADCFGCGYGEAKWKVTTSFPGHTVVQLICFEIEIDICTKIDGDCKATSKKSCKTCYLEKFQYIDFEFFSDTWRFPYTKIDWETCGSRGKASITSTIREYDFKDDSRISDEVPWKEPEERKPVIVSCDEYEIEASTSFVPAELPLFWSENLHTHEVRTSFSMNWDCCNCNNMESKASTSTTSKDGMDENVPCTNREPDKRWGF